MTEHTTTPEGDRLRAEARDAERRAQESFDRSDTDGFLSQWASGMTAQLKREEARVADAGGTDVFPALFDLDGNLVAAKLIPTKYGSAWGLLASDDPRSNITRWVSAFPQRKATMERKGYREGQVRVAARAKIAGSGTGLSGAASCYVTTVRRDGGFSRNVEIVDDGR